MTGSLVDRQDVQELISKVSGLDRAGGSPRLKAIVHRTVSDIMRIVEDLDISMSEFWTAMSYFTSLGQSNEFGLLVPGVGIESFFDLLMDEKMKKVGATGGTPRTIEGPLWVEGAPLTKSVTRLDDGSEEGDTMIMHGVVTDRNGKPVPGAILDVWHAGPKGGYSFFDKTQTEWNLRRRIEVGQDGRYSFRSIMPSGYSLPTTGPSQELMDLLGRHGTRPAHIHFFVSAPGYLKLTTQLNIDNDPYLWDDFAFATREGLILTPVFHPEGSTNADHDVNGAYAEITFDFVMIEDTGNVPNQEVERAHLVAPAPVSKDEAVLAD